MDQNNSITGTFLSKDGVERPLHELNYLGVMSSADGHKSLSENMQDLVNQSKNEPYLKWEGTKSEENAGIERTIVRGMVDVITDANESIKQDLVRGPRVLIGDPHIGLGRSALTEALLADAKLRRVEAMDFGKPWNLEDLLRGLHLLPMPIRISKFANIHAINRQRRLKQRR